MAQRREVTAGRSAGAEREPYLTASMRITLPLGSYSSLSVSLEYGNLRLARIAEDLAAVREAAPAVVVALDDDLGGVLKEALGEELGGAWQVEFLKSLVRHLEQHGRRGSGDK